MKKREWMKKLLSLALCAVMVFGVLPAGQTRAAGTPLDVVSGSKVTDPATLNNWKTYFPITGELNTEYAGGVWSDKSVFTTVDSYLTATDEVEKYAPSMKDAENNFLVALSAMASTKSIKGYSSIPTDTILVLDMSSSMRYDIDDLAAAANEAVKTLLNVNYNNRVGVVLYSGDEDSSVLLELDRYTTSAASGNYLQYYTSSGRGGIQVVSGVKGSDDVSETGKDYYHSGTFTQDGVYIAMKQLLAADKVVEGGIQDGEARMPIIVLMTDGAPTLLSNNYTGTNGTVDQLSANTSVAEGSSKDFMNQVQAAYAKYMLENSANGYQEHDLLFYTLGFNVTKENAPALWPTANGETKSYWDRALAGQYATANDGLRVSLAGTDFLSALKSTDAEHLREDGTNKYYFYVDQYFSASGNNLNAAFQAIVNEIILQSLYFPTLIEEGGTHHTGGYLEFTDEIGHYMEVVDIKGIQLGDTLFTGAAFTGALASGEMGTESNPTDLGNNFVWSVKERLHITDTDQAWNLIQNAWNSGQLSYTNDNIFSNYVGWYGNLNSKNEMVYQSWWNGDMETAKQSGNAYAIKSYGFQGNVVQGHRVTDMYYITVQVRTHIASGETEVHFRIPASLIPLVEYEVELNSTELSDVKNLGVGGASAPIRLLFEVGLRSDINSLNVTEKIANDYPYYNSNTGVYDFYTNQWDPKHGTATIPDVENNTSVWFEPSMENERYYFHEDTPVKTGANGQYTERYVYIKSNGTTTATLKSEALPAAAAGKVENGKVPAGTPRLDTARGPVDKKDPADPAKSGNFTGTQPHFEHPQVLQNPYHLGAILGNNGKLSIRAAQGIKLTKLTEVVDGQTLPADQVYTFIIESASSNAPLASGASFHTHRESNGRIGSAVPVAADQDGKISVSLKKNETLYIVGLPAGSYTVTETAGEGYSVTSFVVNGITSSNGAVVAVADRSLSNVVVTNGKVINGAVSIGKQVVSAHADHMNKEFSFTVKLSAALAGKTYSFTHPRLNGTVKVDAEGKALFSYTAADGTAVTDAVSVPLKQDESIRITGLPAGTVVTASEIDVENDGFAAVSDKTATIVSGRIVDIDFVNTYAPEGTVSPKDVINVTVNKTVDGNTWESGTKTFKFDLEKHVSTSEHTTVASGSLEFSALGTDSVVLDWGNHAWDAAGVYSYRIVEDTSSPEAGIAYDPVTCHFDVVVADDGNGGFKIADVIKGDDTAVTYDKTSKTWTVTASFTNIYNISGVADAVIHVKKQLVNPSNAPLSAANFEFELYEADEHYTINTEIDPITQSTNHVGDATFALRFQGSDIPNDTHELHKYYVLKEKQGSISTVDYSKEEYYIHVILSDNNSKLSVAMEVSKKENNSVTLINAVEDTAVTVSAPVFAYDPETGLISLNCDTDGALVYYRIGEEAEQLYTAPFAMGVSETTEIHARAVLGETSSEMASAIYRVLAGEESVTYELEQITGFAAAAPTDNNVLAEQSVTFTNTYNPADASLTLGGTKTILGRDMLDKEIFNMSLYETGSSFTVASDAKPVRTAQVSAAKNGEPASFVFTELSFPKVGTYYYVIREEAGSAPGMTYDADEFRVTVQVIGETVGQLTAVETIVDKAGHINPVAFTNTYVADPCDAEITVEKTLFYTNEEKNIAFSEGIFSFELYQTGADFVVASGAQPLAAETAGGTSGGNVPGTAVFKLPYDMADLGTHYYVIREVLPTENGEYNGAKYNTEDHPVTVVVRDDGSGQLKATVNGSENSSAIQIKNEYTADAASIILNGKKALEDEKFAEGSSVDFIFGLYQTDANYEITGDPIDTETVSITEANKAFEFAFDRLNYDTIGTRYYVVKEHAGTDALVEYDATVYQVEVAVRDNGKGSLIAEKTVTIKDLPTTEEPAITFANTRIHPDDLTVNVEIKKTVLGASSNESFAFVLQQTGANYTDSIGNPTDVTVNGSGVVNQELVFTEEHLNQTLYYTLSETSGSTQGMTYDDMQYRFKVQIALDEGKNLTATITDETVYPEGHAHLNITAATEDEADKVAAPFTNENYPGIDVTIDVTKKIENLGSKKLSPKGFQFVLTHYTDRTYTTADTSETVTSNDSGSAVFGNLSFTTEDVGKTFYYTISEIKGSKTGVTYDDTVYKVTITVERDDVTGLKAVITCDPTGTIVGNHLNVGFVNQYYKRPWWPITPPGPEPSDPVTPVDPVKPQVKPDVPVTPDTGDSSHLILWAAVMAAGVIGFITTMICAIRRRRFR